ncbi:MAG TPA: iron-containing alcohol dehydrogenase [Spirochaetota bacterium]|nr:iron-containing alcohol dehydrogenase [Spirochaetota bacterium]HPL17137.1 iron-containing alcohol dehydrogenase [Spirochaetota bacterium]HQF07116.1 iron-containing alcohol dehydrogenase [Spirochaetota bacterium]HQH95853.1 iron-containing alcohol dehydrogenase [Spirochaetota bacterium]HQJ72043.1 iron-containing alcohol dehydrogenase [Spirochaetota bacterium]
MMPFRKPLLRIFKTIMAKSMYLVPPQISTVEQGPGSVKKLPALIREKGFRKPLVVTDSILMKMNLLKGLFREFDAIGMEYAVYDGVLPNPTIENVEEAYALYARNGCDAIIGFGGGSPMDTAKVVAARVVRPGRTADRLGGYFKVTLPVPKRLPRIFAVPTTAGTGAETTSAAVVTDVRKNIKFTVNDFAIHPHYIVLDPELTLGLPPFFTAITAMDALSHATEGYIGGARCKKTDDHTEKAVKMIFDNIDRVFKNGKDVKARYQMILASYYAGIVLNRALTGYVHPFAHKIGGLYHLPHGRVIGAVMPLVFECYGARVHKRLGRLADVIGVSRAGMDDARKAAAFIEAIREFNRKFGIGETVPELREKDFPAIARSIHRECIPYPAPKIMDDTDVFAILKRLKGNQDNKTKK